MELPLLGVVCLWSGGSTVTWRQRLPLRTCSPSPGERRSCQRVGCTACLPPWEWLD